MEIRSSSTRLASGTLLLALAASGCATTAELDAEDTGEAGSALGADLWLEDYGYEQGWRVDRHPRAIADVNGDTLLDVVGFHDDGIRVSPSLGYGFMSSTVWLADMGYGAGWRTGQHPRMLADVDGDRRADVVGFSGDGVWVSRSLGSSFSPAERWLDDFGYAAGWRVESSVRRVADMNADGLADVIAIGKDGVHLSLSTGAGFAAPVLVSEDFTIAPAPGLGSPGGGSPGGGSGGSLGGGLGGSLGGGLGGSLGGGLGGSLGGSLGGGLGGGLGGSLGGGLGGSLGGSLGGGLGGSLGGGLGRPIVGGLGGLGGLGGGLGRPIGGGLGGSLGGGLGGGAGGGGAGSGAGSSGGLGSAVARSFPQLGDFDGDGDLDIADFRDDGVHVALFDGERYGEPTLWTIAFGANIGNWRADRHLRTIADVNGDGKADIVGFHELGVFAAVSTGAAFANPGLWTQNFGYMIGEVTGEWRLDKHIRQLTDLNGDRRADIIGFGEQGVWVAMSNGTRFNDPELLVNDFGSADWDPARHVRLVGDVIGDRAMSAVGFGERGVYVRRFF